MDSDSELPPIHIQLTESSRRGRKPRGYGKFTKISGPKRADKSSTNIRIRKLADGRLGQSRTRYQQRLAEQEVENEHDDVPSEDIGDDRAEDGAGIANDVDPHDDGNTREATQRSQRHRRPNTWTVSASRLTKTDHSHSFIRTG